MARVLLVEDESLIAMGMVLSLEGAGYEVCAVSHGQHALEVLDRGFRPDVIVTDYTMPQMDGEALIDHVRRRPELDSVPVLLVSGVPAHSLPDGIQFDAYVRKPCLEDRLIEAVRVLITVGRRGLERFMV